MDYMLQPKDIVSWNGYKNKTRTVYAMRLDTNYRTETKTKTEEAWVLFIDYET